MENKLKKPELLAPAGDLERLKTAVVYGADAVYIGGQSFGLRAKAKNFGPEEMALGIEFAHSKGARVYVTANIFAHNGDFDGMAEYFKEVYKLGADALIISDPGVFLTATEVVPDMDIHISTQANNTNYRSGMFWRKQGAKRMVVARELTLEEIKEIGERLSGECGVWDFEIEAFVHGAMCISYSGRCLLSNYMSGRDSNRGECSHPCRWKYGLMEETRPGEFYPVEEDERGTYIFNSKDLCMLGHIPELVKAGIDSFKIEGRMKTPYYVATVVKAYREAIDDYFADENLYRERMEHYFTEVKKSSHRNFTTGFYFGKPDAGGQIYNSSTYIRQYDFVGVVKSFDSESGFAQVEQRNKFSVGDEVEVLTSRGEGFRQIIEEMYDKEGQPISEAPHAQQLLKIKVDKPVKEFDMLRKALK